MRQAATRAFAHLETRRRMLAASRARHRPGRRSTSIVIPELDLQAGMDRRLCWPMATGCFAHFRGSVYKINRENIRSCTAEEDQATEAVFKHLHHLRSQLDVAGHQRRYVNCTGEARPPLDNEELESDEENANDGEAGMTEPAQDMTDLQREEEAIIAAEGEDVEDIEREIPQDRERTRPVVSDRERTRPVVSPVQQGQERIRPSSTSSPVEVGDQVRPTSAWPRERGVVRTSDPLAGPPLQRPRLQHQPWPTPPGWTLVHEEVDTSDVIYVQQGQAGVQKGEVKEVSKLPSHLQALFMGPGGSREKEGKNLLPSLRPLNEAEAEA
eukprot:2250735-Amphidinium_carterae.1